MYDERRQAHGRVSYVWWGKHGIGDIRVEFDGEPPTFAEFLTLAWGLARSEDRYVRGKGRRMLKELVDEIWRARDWSEAKPIIERAQRSVDEKRAA